MKLIVCKNYEEMSKKASDIVANIIKENPNAKLGLATGSTPIGLYQNLVKEYNDGKLDFKNVKTVNLDEYVGIDSNNTQSYRYFMNFNLFDRVNIDKNNTNVPFAKDNLEESVKDYDKLLEDFGQRDVQVMGIGANGHIAFNEPDTKLNMHTSIIDLKEETIIANSRFFDSKEDVPKKAISMGLADAFNSKTLVVLASGLSKHAAVEKLLNTTKIDTQFPLSFITLHPNCYLIVDEEAYNG